jgi:lysophospholipase L1-like esterase
MPTDLSLRSGRRTRRWIDTVSIVVVVTAWLTLVLEEQYHVAWLRNYLLASDTLFVAGIGALALTRSGEQWGAARVRRVGLRLVFSVAILTGALAAAEVATRLAFRSALAPPGPHVSFNSLGFREREIGPKDSNRYRIAVIGDSFTAGNGIEERDRFSNLIERFLGPQYEVLNFGKPAHNLPEHVDMLDRVLKMRPDFVLLQLYENDFETRTMRRPQTYPLLPSKLDRRMVRSSLLYRLLAGCWVQLQEAVGLTEGYTDYMARHLADPNLPDARKAFGMLRQFIDRARGAGVPVGVVLFPFPEDIGPNTGNYPFGYLHEHVRAICAEKQIPYLDLLPAFSTFRDPRSMWVSPFDAHPNAKANRRAAFEILNAFAPVWQH